MKNKSMTRMRALSTIYFELTGIVFAMLKFTGIFKDANVGATSLPYKIPPLTARLNGALLLPLRRKAALTSSRRGCVSNMRIAPHFAVIGAVLLAATFALQKAAAQDASKCLYNDEHFHVQDFKAEGPRLPEVLKMMDNHVCRTTLMSLAITLAHDPLIDRDFAPVYYTQTDGQVMYYNAIQDVLVAHKFLALPEQERARVDPLMNTFNLKDARAGDYIKQMVHLYPGVWSGFGEIHFKKQEFSEKLAGGPPSLYSASVDAIFDVIGEMGTATVVHCDHDTPYNLALLGDLLPLA
jgi:hypothetical protein